jgi:RimJ/RimL family protein N-acetyltransferase
VSVRLVPLSGGALAALERGDLETAGHLMGLPVPEEFWAPVEIWTHMLRLLAADPGAADWLMNAVVVGDVVVGNAGFKGAPVDGVVELGYRISPAHRRRGHAVAAVRALLDRGRREPLVTRVVARVDPANSASLAVVGSAGFVPDGEHESPRSGRQLQFSHATPTPSPGAADPDTLDPWR